MADITTGFATIFRSQLQKLMYADNTFLSRFNNLSGEVLNNGKTVSQPQYTDQVTITKNGYTNASAYGNRNTVEEVSTWDLNSYRTEAMVVQDFVESVTKYGKLDSVSENMMKQLSNWVAQDILFIVTSDIDDSRKVYTTGSVLVGNGLGGSDQKSLSFKDLVKISQKFAEDNVNGEKYILLDPTMYYELLSENEELTSSNRFGKDTLAPGLIDYLAGINIMMRSKVAGFGTNGTAIDFNSDTIAATDLRAGFAWSPEFVHEALGSTKTFNGVDPNAYGDVLSMEVYAGAKLSRIAGTRIGCYALIQG